MAGANDGEVARKGTQTRRVARETATILLTERRAQVDFAIAGALSTAMVARLALGRSAAEQPLHFEWRPMANGREGWES